MVDSIKNPSASPLHKDWRLALALNVVTAFTDIGLASGMVYHLLKERMSSQNLNRMVLWLVIFSVNSGIWTALLAVAVLVTIVVLPPTNLIFAAVYLISCPLYCNACLGNLICRDFLRGVARQKLMRSSLPLEVISEDTEPPRSANIIWIDTTPFSEPNDDRKRAMDQKKSLPHIV